MSIKSDRWIRRMAQEQDMINPYSEKQVSAGVISYGVSSYGYDLRVADEFKIFTNVNSTIVDPKHFDERSFVTVNADVAIVPPNSFALARSVEYFKIPRDVLTVCVGKSTYARCGIIVNVTPFQGRSVVLPEPLRPMRAMILPRSSIPRRRPQIGTPPSVTHTLETSPRSHGRALARRSMFSRMRYIQAGVGIAVRPRLGCFHRVELHELNIGTAAGEFLLQAFRRGLRVLRLDDDDVHVLFFAEPPSSPASASSPGRG